MKFFITFLTALLLASPAVAATWPLDGVDDSLIVRGKVTTAAGAVGQSLVLDGGSLVELKDSANLGGGAFTVSLWFNPYDLAGGQQMLVGKNRYSLDERQWGLTIEPDGKLKAYLRQSGWSTIPCNEPLVAGRWHLATLAVDAQKASLYLNGKPVGEVSLNSPIADTPAPITLGGIWDADAVQQAFHGAVDEFSFQPRALSAEEIATSYQPVLVTNELPQLWDATQIWDATQTLPNAADLSPVKDAKFYVLGKLREDGANFTLGVGLAWHKDKLYASYGFSTSEQENTAHEEAHVRVSEDGGKTWNPPVVMDAGAGNLGVSHGVFLSHGGKLWAFMGAFYDNFYGPTSRTHTRSYVLNENSGNWEPQGVVLDQGFWPMQEPQQMADGNWIMSGVRITFGLEPGVVGHLPAVAISQGDDFTKWRMVLIHTDSSVGTTNLWGESTVIVEPTKITNIARRSAGVVRGDALVSISKDHGLTWTPAAESNLPMATQKPYAGTLSTGQRYLIGTITADTDGRRSPLTIAVSKPGESLFSRVFLIRTSVFDGTPGVSAPNADFSYPYAVERNGQLYIAYTDKEHIYNELVVIPVSSLEIKEVASASYTVTYDANGATGGTAPADQTKTQDVALTLATNSGNLARTGFTFAGWNTAADGTGTNYAVGSSYTANAALTLFAKWTSVSSGILYWDNSGGTANDWGSLANWSTVVVGGTNPLAIPGASDVATFSATPIVGTAQTVNLNADRSVQGINIASTVTQNIFLQGGGILRTLTIGADGVTNASNGAGSVQIGLAGSITQNVNLTLNGSQSWANNGTQPIRVRGAVTGMNSPTLTNNGTGTGGARVHR